MSELRDWRESLGLSRQEVAAEAGVTVSAVASVEAGRGSRDREAEQKIRLVLEIKLRPHAREEKDEPAWTPPPRGRKRVEERPLPTEWVVTEEFLGLSPESRFTVEGEDGVFVFIRHVATPKGEWVDAYGGEKEHKAFRSFRCERVKPVRFTPRKEDEVSTS